jgi:nucleotide-binding universal stress UspA family protein
MEREATARARKARAVFDTWCGEAKITARASDSGSALTSSAATWRELVGQEDDEVALVARNVDVVLLARRDDMRGTDLVAFCLFNSGRPMLLTPPSVPAKLGGHIGIFWNGGVQSARAVGDAMPLLRRSDRITVYTTGAEGPAPSAGDLARRLSQAGMTTMVDMVSPGIKSAAVPLLEAAERDDVDLIVMGGFGHGRFRELIFGGVTKAVVQNSRAAAFLSH